MSDYIINLIAKNLGEAATLKPRPLARFEPATMLDAAGTEAAIPAVPDLPHLPPDLAAAPEHTSTVLPARQEQPLQAAPISPATTYSHHPNPPPVATSAAQPATPAAPVSHPAYISREPTPSTPPPLPDAPLHPTLNTIAVVPASQRGQGQDANPPHPALNSIAVVPANQHGQATSAIPPAGSPEMTTPLERRARQGAAIVPADSARPATERSAPAAPTIRVTIGRVEVRAITPPPPPRPAASPSPRPPMSLDDYLKRGERPR